MTLPNAMLVSCQFGPKTSIIALDEDGHVATELSYTQLLRASSVLLNGAFSSTLKKGDTAMVVMPSCVEFVAVTVALLHRGVVIFPLNPAFKLDQITAAVRQVKPTVVIGTESNVKLLHAAAGDESTVFQCPKLVRKSAGDENVNLDDFVLGPKLDNGGTPAIGNPADKDAGTVPDPGLDDPVVLLFTSGTTGVPKGATLTHRNLLTSMEILSQAHHITKEDTCLLATPLYHVAGFCGSLLLTLVTGGTLVIPPPGAAHPDFWKHVLQHRVTWFHTVPTLLRILLKFDGVNQCRDAQESRLRFVRCSGSSLSQELLEEAEAATGKPLMDVYGMTESSPGIFCNKLTAENRVAGIFPIPRQVLVKIPTVSNGVANTPSGVGELCIRGSSVITSYCYTDAASNAAAFDADGFFRTGDLAQFVNGGFLQLRGRIKETVNKGGVKINPAEVDTAFLQHADVAEAVCFTAQDEEFGEDICAAVVVEPSCDVTTTKLQQALRKDLRRFLRQRLAGFQIPRDIHFVSDLPRTALGKYNRKQLTEKYGQLAQAA